MGADTKANAQELIREAGGLLERLQRGVALETLDESESSLGAEAVGRDTASTGAEAGAEACQGALTQKRTLGRWFVRRFKVANRGTSRDGESAGALTHEDCTDG